MRIEAPPMELDASSGFPAPLGWVDRDRAAAILLLRSPLLQLAGIGMRWPVLGWRLGVSAWMWFTLLSLAVCAGLWAGRRWARAPGAALALLVTTVYGLMLVEVVPWWMEEIAERAAWVDVGVPLGLAATAGAALVQILRGWRRDPAFRDAMGTALAAFGIQVALLCGIAVLGLGRFDGPWYQVLMQRLQAPGTELLIGMGQCCGANGGVVFSDGLDPHWGGLTPIGIPILGVANSVGLIPFVPLARRVRRRFATRAVPREIAA